MKRRCESINHHDYKRYGAAGVTVCKRWHDFAKFLADMGTRPPGYSLDRINPFGNYTPTNCRWATPKEQANNRRKHFY
jgi:hypothetical protein